MARFNYGRMIIHKCGHSKDYSLSCHNAAEANMQASNLRKFDCPECLAAKQKFDQDHNLPPLAGSVGQLSWASDIRRRVVTALQKRGLTEGLVRIREITSAKWFIDHREAKLSFFISGAI